MMNKAQERSNPKFRRSIHVFVSLVYTGYHNIPRTKSKYSVAYRAVAKQLLSKQWLLLGNARNIHVRNNRMTGLCSPFLSNKSVNTPTRGALLETVFYYVRAKCL
jgi:hypothetical protein